jgi:TRAP-type C4-dicarboxylate transport system substrate-binding protein
VTKKFYEVTKYYTLDEHMRIPDLIVMSLKLYNQLNEQQKAAVLQAGALTQAYMRGAWKISENKDLADLKGKFTQIIEVDKQPFMDAVKPLVMAEAKRLNTEKTIEFILDSGKKF